MFNVFKIPSPSVVKRVAIGKIIGFAIGLIAAITLTFISDSGLMLRIGIVMWYTMLGAIIGVFGIFTKHPIFQFPIRWWVRSTAIGGFMNCILVFIAYNEMHHLISSSIFSGMSPFILVLEGIIVGLLIGYFSTKFGGEGKETLS